MANKKLWFGMLVIALVFGMTVISCDDDSGGGGGDSEWVNVTSLAQINGTWKGTYIETNEDAPGVTRKSEIEEIYTINASARTMTLSLLKEIMTFSGSASDLNTYWNNRKSDYTIGTHTSEYVDENGNTYTETYTVTYSNGIYTVTEPNSDYTYTVTINDSAHTMTMMTSNQTQTLTDADIASLGIQVSKDGTKLRYLNGPIFYKQ